MKWNLVGNMKSQNEGKIRNELLVMLICSSNEWFICLFRYVFFVLQVFSFWFRKVIWFQVPCFMVEFEWAKKANCVANMSTRIAHGIEWDLAPTPRRSGMEIILFADQRRLIKWLDGVILFVFCPASIVTWVRQKALPNFVLKHTQRCVQL